MFADLFRQKDPELPAGIAGLTSGPKLGELDLKRPLAGRGSKTADALSRSSQICQAIPGERFLSAALRRAIGVPMIEGGGVPPKR